MKKEVKNKKVFLHEGHEYVTRRQLLGAGVIPFAASIVMPTLWDVLFRNGIAEAQTACPAISAAASPFPAIIQVNFSGGPAVGQWAAPLMSNQSLLTNAGNLGLGSVSTTYTQKAMFGNGILIPQANGTSAVTTLGAFFNAVASTAGATATAKTSVVVNAVTSGDDTSSDTENISGMISKWVTGTKAPPVGNTGIGQVSALVAAPKSVTVSSATSLAGLLAPATGSLNATLSPNQKQAVYNTVASLSASQAASLGSMPGGSTMSSLLNCAGIQNVQLAQQSAPTTDPRGIASLQTIYGITTTTSATSSAVVEASIVNAALLGLTPLAQYQFGGYDYHGNPRSTTDAQDTTGGLMVGRAIAAAAAMNKALFVVVTCDGATGADSQSAAGAPSSGDRGSGSANFIIAFNPTAAPKVSKNFLNGYTTGQVADTGYSGTDVTSAISIVANIMNNTTGSSAAFTSLFGSMSGAPTATQLASILVM